MKIESKLLMKVAFAIILVCGMEMKPVPSTKESAFNSPSHKINKALIFCKGINPKEVKADLFLMNLGFNKVIIDDYNYLDNLVDINNTNRTIWYKLDKLFGHLSFDEKKELYGLLPEKERDHILKTFFQKFKKEQLKNLIHDTEEYSEFEIKQYLKKKICNNLKLEIEEFNKDKESIVQKERRLRR